MTYYLGSTVKPHPIIQVKDLAKAIEKLLPDKFEYYLSIHTDDGTPCVSPFTRNMPNFCCPREHILFKLEYTCTSIQPAKSLKL